MHRVVSSLLGFAFIKYFWLDDQILHEVRRYVKHTYGSSYFLVLDFKRIIEKSKNNIKDLYIIIDSEMNEIKKFVDDLESVAEVDRNYRCLFVVLHVLLFLMIFSNSI